ncbi:MAG: murein biosynthesis integral membrane protein MurJ [Akkermansiaceae bacterium]
MLRSLMTISGFTLMSRVLGVVRDILIARFLGTGVVADAFFAAFRFPNMFRRIFGEGAFNAAFVPLFGKRVTADGRNSAMQFANNAFTILFGTLGVLTLVAIPLMAAIMLIVVPGFLPKAEESLGSETKEFRIPLRGAKAVYLQTEGGEADFENLCVVERGQPAFLEVLGEVFGGDVKAEGEEVQLTSILTEGLLRDREVEFKKSDTKEEKQRSIKAARDLLYKDGRWLANDEGLLRIPLPPDHDYAVFKGMASGEGELAIYNNDIGAYDLTVKLSQITFVYLLCMALVAHLSGVLTTLKKFAAPAFSPVILNLVFLCGLLGLVQFVEWRGVALAYCVAVAGFLQLGVLWWVCLRAGLPVALKKPVFDSGFKRLLILMGPGVVAAGIQQINLLVGGIVASFQQGAISYIYYADRIYQLPLGMIGIAFGMVLLPEITRLLNSDKEKEARSTMVSGLELAMIVTVPAAIALMVIPQEIISVIFERGTFTASDSLQTGRALGAFAIGLPGYVLIKVLQPGYFARENTKSPMWMAGITVIVNIVFSLLLFPFLGHVGIAIATSISAWVNVVLLWVGLHGFVSLDRENWRRLGGMLIASLVMALGLLGAKALMSGWLDAGPFARGISTGILVGFGALVYGIGVLILKVTSLSELKSAFRK